MSACTENDEGVLSFRKERLVRNDRRPWPVSKISHRSIGVIQPKEIFEAGLVQWSNAQKSKVMSYNNALGKGGIDLESMCNAELNGMRAGSVREIRRSGLLNTPLRLTVLRAGDF